MAAIGKRKRVSKNKKKNWRKHSNIKDVEEHLEEKRFEERTGGPVSSKTNVELFFLDKEQKKEKPGTQERGKKRKALRCFSHLEPSKWPEAFIKPNRTRRPEEKQNPLFKGRKKQKKDVSASPNILSKRIPDKIRPNWHPEFDLWGQEDEPDTVVGEDLKNYYLEQIKKKKMKVPEFRFKKPSALPAVVVPNPGASYNPTFDDYHALMVKANEIEVKKKKEEDHLQRVLPKFIDYDPKRGWLREMSQGLFEEAESSSGEEDELDIAANPPVRATDRKPKQKRRREHEAKLLQKQTKEQKVKNKMENEVFRIKSLKAEIKAETEKSAETQKKRLKKQEAKLYQPAKLSPYPFVAPDVEVLLPDELSGSLREIKPQGDLLEDRIKSFQSRNIIEARIRQIRKRKYPLKTFKRKSHKTV